VMWCAYLGVGAAVGAGVVVWMRSLDLLSACPALPYLIYLWRIEEEERRREEKRMKLEAEWKPIVQ